MKQAIICYWFNVYTNIDGWAIEYKNNNIFSEKIVKTKDEAIRFCIDNNLKYLIV